MNDLSAVVSAIAGAVLLVATVIAVYLVTKSKRVETSLRIMGESVDVLSTANAELRSIIDQNEATYKWQRAEDRRKCDQALAEEVEARRKENIDCNTKIATLQGKVDALTTNIADVISTAVLKTLEVSTAVQGPKHND